MRLLFVSLLLVVGLTAQTPAPKPSATPKPAPTSVEVFSVTIDGVPHSCEKITPSMRAVLNLASARVDFLCFF